MKRDTTIIIGEYNPEWSNSFEQLKVVYQACLQDLVFAIEHVGSTSVIGLAAKPILDIDFVVEDEPTMKKVIARLSTLGYQHRGDLGILGREVFKQTSQKTPCVASGRAWPTHHLYACLKGSTSLRNHLLFRDYLRKNPVMVKEYTRLKKQLAASYPADINQYVAGKTSFITTILKQAGMSQIEINQIREQNSL